MTGERTKGLIVQGARVSTRPATPNEKAQLLRPMSPPWISRLYMHIFLQRAVDKEARGAISLTEDHLSYLVEFSPQLSAVGH